MTANQADKTNDQNEQEEKTEQTQDSSQGKSDAAKLRDLNREKSKRIEKLTAEQREKDDRLQELDKQLQEIREKANQVDELQKKLEEKEWKETKEQKKKAFLEKYPHLKQYEDELDEIDNVDEFNKEAIYYFTEEKNIPVHTAEYNKQKSKDMGISGVNANGSGAKKDPSQMTAEEYRQALINGEI